MKKHIFAITLLIASCTILNGCMITWPIVDDLDHYKKWDTYESIRNEKSIIKNEEWTIGNEVESNIKDNTDSKAIENCISARNNNPMLYEDESVIELHNQFENTKDFCTEFIKTNPMFYNDTIWINESWEPVWRGWKAIENSEKNIEIIENSN